ncbi:Signal transduction histidine kinase [Beijerinckiaceae bacterium RH AL1]|nr:HAMP domain-containing sensor histidine kinase [Beijerinckiaceae bacterium]VVB42135.1 Signal transduction histidine kinase [Beijerinckiaceae bacterium RH AL8]VVB42136.1 Signal transduction histidine kinase [Beijerinckiaceae bacterium RH CH11]VVC53155.1 Signal transduction histidine kinase [Beijerinckiaceae bacterium RH AL1]
MRDIATVTTDTPPASRRRLPRFGLAGRLIVLIAVFVMTAEVMIYVPSIANMRFNWVRHHLAGAETAAWVLENAPDKLLSDTFSRELLKNVEARLIVLDQNGTRRILAAGNLPSRIDEVDDLRESDWPSLLGAAYRTIVAPPGRVLTLVSPMPNGGGDLIEVTMDEAPLKRAIGMFSRRLLIYSLIVSVIVATLAAFAMHRMILRPVRRLTDSIVEFGADPGDRSRIIQPSAAPHEIGQAERALAVMQEALALELSQKKNLANLGLAVAKINHDMRNMLSAAQILTDRLGNITDPLAQRLAPKLVATLDRAIRFCQATLTYGRAADEPPRPRQLALRGIVTEAVETVAPVAHSPVRVENEVPSDFELSADAEQMFRILLNLIRNGVEAVERAGAAPGRLPMVVVRAWRESSMTIIEVADTGPGIPVALRPKIFSAFQNSTRPGGTGLGLAIVADLVRAHGGTIALRDGEDWPGACFRITLPWLPTRA